MGDYKSWTYHVQEVFIDMRHPAGLVHCPGRSSKQYSGPPNVNHVAQIWVPDVRDNWQKLSMAALMQLTSFDWEWSYHYIMRKRDVHACFVTASWACIVTLSCENEPNERALHWQKRESSILFGASHQYLQQTVNKLRSICSWLDNIWTLVGACFKLLRMDLWEH